MPLRRSQQIIIGAVIFLALVFLLMYLGVIPGFRQTENLPQVSLNFWGVSDDPSAFIDIIEDYQKIHPNIRVNYRQLSADSYEDSLLNALAANQPIDILMFANDWLPKHFDKIMPLPVESLSQAGSPFTFTDFQNLYPTVAIQDLAPDKNIYALPLYVDTLAFFYNRDIFDSKGIALPPRNWSEFQTMITKLKKPVAIGGTERSISHATDLISLLFLQAGAPMIDQTFGQASFSQQGEGALSFYTQFVNPKSAVYTWSDNNKYSLDSFAEGTTAAIFAYQSQIKELKDHNPYLPLKVAPMPQPTASLQAVNWPRYYALAVSRTSRAPLEAWKFLLFAAANQNEAEKYINRTQRPPALRSLINKKLNDVDLGIFAKQALSARSYPQIDNLAIEALFNDMIKSVITGQLSVYSAVVRAESEMSRLIQQRRK